MAETILQWLLPDGRAGGRGPDGKLVKLRGGVPGDVVAKDDAGAPVVIQPSPHRRTAPCPWSSACGGCDLDVLEPATRRQALAQMVGHAFRWTGDVPWVPSPRDPHRARVKLAIEDGRCGYRAARSHELVDIDMCRIARPEIQDAHARLRTWLAQAGGTGLETVELRSDGQRVVFSFSSSGSVPRATRDALGALGDVALDGRRVSGDPVLWLTVLGARLKARPRSFFQVNLEVNDLLAAHVRQRVLNANAERVLDLYAGIGNLSVPIAEAGVPVVGVEAPGAGAEDLRDNAADRPLLQAVARRVERFDTSREPFDVAVLDPPRAGAPGILTKLQRNRPRRIVYVSCFAPAAARDLQELRGYRLTELTAFELFVDTHHVEAVAVLDRERQ